MSFVAVAIGGAALAGSVISSNKASSASKNASRTAAASDAAQLDFAKDQYEDWLDAFGDIRDNLTQYYEGLSPEKYEAERLQAFEEERALALEQLDTTLAQRGITSSGIAREAYTQIALDSAKERAKIRANSEDEVAMKQRESLQIGMGQNPANNVYNALSSQAANANQAARDSAIAAGQAQGKLLDTTFNTLETFLKTDWGSSSTSPTEPETFFV